MSRQRLHAPIPAGARQRGAVAIVVAVTLAVLVGFLGLALDLGKLYVARSELQNSADACALAAARDLTGATPLSVSEAAGITAGGRNGVLFQKYQVDLTANDSVTYSDTLSGFLPKDSVTVTLDKIKYVRCDVRRTGIAHWFAQILNLLPGAYAIGPATVSAYAVATTGSAQTTCAVPVFLCKPSTMSPAQPDYTVGQWLVAKLDAGNKGEYGGGNFGWADLAGGNSASQIASQLDGAGQCNLPAIGSEVGTPGNKASLADDWNSRFGIVKGSKVLGVTDFTGFAYNDTTWTAKSNAYDGTSTDSKGTSQPNFLAARKAYRAYQGDSVTNLSTQGNAAPSSSYQSGADRRLVLAPVVDCSTLATPGTHKVPVQSWACLLMVEPMQTGGNIDSVRLEYRGGSSDPGSPCATQGLPGAGTGVGPKVPMLVQ